MSALLRQVEELLSEHGAAFSYGLNGYLIAIGDQIFVNETFSGVVSDAWSYVCEKESSNA